MFSINQFNLSPSFLRSATVSKMLDPVVITSSMIRHESPAPNRPSISFLVPYDLVSLRRINIGRDSLIDTNVAMGNAVYGTPHT